MFSKTRGILIYPTLAHNEINIEMTGETKAVSFHLVDIFGQLIGQQHYNLPVNQINRDISKLNPGYYLILLHTEKENHAFRFCKM